RSASPSRARSGCAVAPCVAGDGAGGSPTARGGIGSGAAVDGGTLASTWALWAHGRSAPPLPPPDEAPGVSHPTRVQVRPPRGGTPDRRARSGAEPGWRRSGRDSPAADGRFQAAGAPAGAEPAPRLRSRTARV